MVGDWDFPVLPQLALLGKLPAFSASQPLTNSQLQMEVQGALAKLRAAGVASKVITDLASINFSVGTLSGGELALSYVSGDRVVVDATAAGNGWFVDSTPLEDQEFTNVGGVLTAKTGSTAAGHMDLLTVLLHEMGHFEGWTELDPTLHPDALMDLTLGAGVRRTNDLDSVFANGPWE